MGESEPEKPTEPTDPVRTGVGDGEDLYDVATWEERSLVDRLAVAVYGGLHWGRRAVLIALALALFLGLFGLAAVLVVEEPILGALGLLSVVPALILMGYLWIDDPTQREPLEPLAVTFLLSVLFATFAAIVNSLFQAPFAAIPVVGMGLFFFLVVGPVEETVKWLAIRVEAYRRPSFDTVVDGVVYGAVAGLGFAAIENLIYILEAYITNEGAGGMAQIRLAAQTAVGRAFVGPGHVLFSALAGYYLGLAKFNPDSRGPIVVKGLLLAAGAHAFYNTVVTYVQFAPVSFVAFVLVFDGLLLLVILRKVSRYESYYHDVVEESGGETATDASVTDPK